MTHHAQPFPHFFQMRKKPKKKKKALMCKLALNETMKGKLDWNENSS
jgi:hypothetical protein